MLKEGGWKQKHVEYNLRSNKSGLLLEKRILEDILNQSSESEFLDNHRYQFSGKLAESMKEADDDGCNEYFEVKARLLEVSGTTVQDAVKVMFAEDKKTWSDKHLKEVWRTGKTLFNRIIASGYSLVTRL